MTREKPAKAETTDAAKPSKGAEAAAGKESSAGPGETSVDMIQRLQREVEDANDRYLRALADIENTRKRLQREKAEYAKFASEASAREWLPIVDSLDQALASVTQQADGEGLLKGVQLIAKQLMRLLENEGVRRMESVGVPFDPHRHEAIAQVEAGDGQADNTVVEEVQVGDLMHGHVLRPAIVKVALKNADSTQQTADSKEESQEHDGEESG